MDAPAFRMDARPTFLDDVEIVGDDGMGLLHCRRRGRHFHVPRYNLLGGSVGIQIGACDLTLVLPRWFVQNLGFDDIDTHFIERAHLRDPARAQRVLIVEDDGDSRDALCALLETWGHHVVCATSGQEALGFAMEMRLDAVVYNLALPDMDGGAFACTLHSVRLTPPPRLVAYSNTPRSAGVPVDVFIQKPEVSEFERLFGPDRAAAVRQLPLPGRRPR